MAGITHKIKVFEELISGAHPRRLQDPPDPTVGQFEDGRVGFQAVQHKNIFSGQIRGGRCTGVGQGRDGTDNAKRCDQNEKVDAY
jgi:hypothetical protein